MKKISNNKKKKTIQVLDRAMKILNCFDNGNELGVTEISKMIDLHKSTVFGIISTLEVHRILEKNDKTGRYRLGLELYRLGTKVNFSLKETVVPYLEQLVNMYQETANLVMLQDTSVVYLEKVESSHSMRISTLVGGKKPLYCTAVGKAILAFSLPNDLENMLRKIEFTKYTDNTITNKQDLLKSLDEIREKGYSKDYQEMETGLYCVAAPIFNEYKVPFAAISISGPVSRINDNLCREIGITLEKFSQKISKKLGYVK